MSQIHIQIELFHSSSAIERFFWNIEGKFEVFLCLHTRYL